MEGKRLCPAYWQDPGVEKREHERKTENNKQQHILPYQRHLAIAVLSREETRPFLNLFSITTSYSSKDKWCVTLTIHFRTTSKVTKPKTREVRHRRLASSNKTDQLERRRGRESCDSSENSRAPVMSHARRSDASAKYRISQPRNHRTKDHRTLKLVL